jgi:transposase InsO family protein
LFIDNYSHYFWIYLLRKKSETFDTFTQFKAIVEKQFDKSILCLHDNKGGEFIGIKWDMFLVQHGIRCKHAVKASPQQNGVAECLNRTLKELLVAMLNSARLPARFWGKGLNYLHHVIVRSPSSAIPTGTTPYAGVVPAANWFDATAPLKGKVKGVPVVSYCKHSVRLSTRPCTRSPAPLRGPLAGPSNEAPPMPNVKEEEEEAAPQAPRELPAANEDEDNDNNLYVQP